MDFCPYFVFYAFSFYILFIISFLFRAVDAAGAVSVTVWIVCGDERVPKSPYQHNNPHENDE